MSTTPGCAYIGGHRDGYDDECAWCKAAADLDIGIEVNDDGTLKSIAVPSEQEYTFLDPVEDH